MHIFIKKPDEQQPLCWYQWQAQKVLDLRKLPPDLPAWHKGLETWKPLEEVLSELPPCRSPSIITNGSAWILFILVNGFLFLGLYESDQDFTHASGLTEFVSSLLGHGICLFIAFLVVHGFRKLLFRNYWRELNWFGEGPNDDETPPSLPPDN